MTHATGSKIELEHYPGHSIRRLQQIAVAIFMQESQESAVTPVQFAVLHKLASQPNVDQRSLARAVSFDTSTIGGVVDRLEARGLLKRSLSPQDRRVRLLNLTSEGVELLAATTPSALRAQSRILEPLSQVQREQLLSLMQTLITHHEALDSRDTGS